MDKIKITLTQDAYLDGNYDDCYYRATAEDADGNIYAVHWDIIDMENFATLEDQSDACDWDKPTVFLDGEDVTDKVVIE